MTMGASETAERGRQATAAMSGVPTVVRKTRRGTISVKLQSSKVKLRTVEAGCAGNFFED
jgi:hypothetical protein